MSGHGVRRHQHAQQLGVGKEGATGNGEGDDRAHDRHEHAEREALSQRERRRPDHRNSGHQRRAVAAQPELDLRRQHENRCERDIPRGGGGGR